MDIKLISNVGYYEDRLVYAAKTPGGTHFLTFFQEDGVNKWKYLRLSALQNFVGAGKGGYASDLNTAIFSNVEQPEFVDTGDNSGGFYTVNTVINGGSIAKKWQGENPYAIRGEGVTDTEISAIKISVGTGLTTGNNSNGTLGGLIPSASEFNTLFSDPIGFIQRNVLFVVAVLAVIYYLRRKKKKPLWIF